MPTRDSAGWLLSFADAYRRLGLSPLYLFDTRSSDDTLALLRNIGADIVPVEPKLDRVEAMLAITRDVVDADWVVRFDDDEIPSRALVAWLNRSLGTIGESSVAISGRHAWFADGRLHYSRLEDFYFWPDDMAFARRDTAPWAYPGVGPAGQEMLSWRRFVRSSASTCTRPLSLLR